MERVYVAAFTPIINTKPQRTSTKNGDYRWITKTTLLSKFAPSLQQSFTLALSQSSCLQQLSSSASCPVCSLDEYKSTTASRRIRNNSIFPYNCGGILTRAYERNRYSQQERTQPTTTTSAVDPVQRFRVYCDLDGVLVDFAQGISQVFGHEVLSQNIDNLPRQLLWERVSQANAFFEHLPWCKGGPELWEAIAPLKPNILTGVPSYCMTSPRMEKFNWCRREIPQHTHCGRIPFRFHHIDKAAHVGPIRLHSTVRSSSYDVTRNGPSELDKEWCCQVITCWSEQKHNESGHGVVLIDDRFDLKHAWEAKGGIFIHHETGNVNHTLRQLRDHGILPRNDNSDYNNDLWGGSAIQP